jgi:hypothetical protein
MRNGAPNKDCLLQLATNASGAVMKSLNRERNDGTKMVMGDRERTIEIKKESGIVIKRMAKHGLSFGLTSSHMEAKPSETEKEDKETKETNKRVVPDESQTFVAAKKRGLLKEPPSDDREERNGEEQVNDSNKVRGAEGCVTAAAAVANTMDIQRLLEECRRQCMEENKKTVQDALKEQEKRMRAELGARLDSVKRDSRNAELENQEKLKKVRRDNERSQRLLAEEARKCAESANRLHQQQNDEKAKTERDKALKRATQRERKERAKVRMSIIVLIGYKKRLLTVCALLRIWLKKKGLEKKVRVRATLDVTEKITC